MLRESFARRTPGYHRSPMARAQLLEVVDVLAGVGAAGRFATRVVVDASRMWLSVKGAGRIGLPVSSVAAAALIRVAKPAKYGKGTQTLHDRRVRDTWVVARSLVTIDPPWREAEAELLAKIRDDLGLPETTTLRAELHDLLVYEHGQFFVPHQDSEKHDDMIGTLVTGVTSCRQSPKNPMHTSCLLDPFTVGIVWC